MDASNHTDEFLAILGHEMRNSLYALNQALEIWSKSTYDPKVMDDLRHIMERQVRQLTRLSEDLLDEARIAQGRLELRCEQLQLQRVIDDACEEIRPFIDRFGHTLTVTMPDEPIVVHGDASRLMQVFANLLQNAAKFTDRNGSLSVSLECQAEKVVVRVRDNGCGIEMRRLTTIFEGNGQVNGTSMPANNGLGIGLKLAKAIVELHGGSVAVESEGLGQGCEFTVLLPTWNKSAHSPQFGTQSFLEAGHAGNGQRLSIYRIVVVDDEPSLGELLARLLRRLGQSVTVAGNGEDAIRIIQEKRPQVVFLDLVMHEMDGYEVARRLRELPDLNEMVLIALSGNGDEAHKRRARDAGINKYVVKPTSTTTLAEILREIPVNHACQF